MSVSVAPLTAMVVESAAARAFVTVAVTVALRPAEPWWVASSTAVTSTVSVPVVAPAAITMVAAAPTGLV